MPVGAIVVVGLVAAVTVVAALADWWAVARGDRRLEALAKPVVLAALVVVALVLGDGTTLDRLVVAALSAGLVGDVALLRDSPAGFGVGVLAFLVGHALWLAACLVTGAEGAWWSWAVVVVLAAVAWAVRRVVPGARSAYGLPVAAAVAAYVLVSGGLLVTAWLTGDVVVAAGATSFVVSDTVLAVRRFDRPGLLGRAQPVVVMVTYHLAQVLLLVGLMA